MDASSIREIIHIGLPHLGDLFLRETGRAGRDTSMMHYLLFDASSIRETGTLSFLEKGISNKVQRQKRVTRSYESSEPLLHVF